MCVHIWCECVGWRNGHKDEYHPIDHGATRDGTPENVMAGVELKDMPSEESSNYQKCDGKAESLLIVQSFQLQVKFAKFMTALFVKIGLTTHDKRAGLEPESEQSNKQALGAENDEGLRKIDKGIEDWHFQNL